jgi:hypothetical protein
MTAHKQPWFGFTCFPDRKDRHDVIERREREQVYFAINDETSVDDLDASNRMEIVNDTFGRISPYISLEALIAAVQTDWRNNIVIEDIAFDSVLTPSSAVFDHYPIYDCFSGQEAEKFSDDETRALAEEEDKKFENFQSIWMKNIEINPAFVPEYCPIASIYVFWIFLSHFGGLLYNPCDDLDLPKTSSQCFKKHFLKHIEEIVLMAPPGQNMYNGYYEIYLKFKKSIGGSWLTGTDFGMEFWSQCIDKNRYIVFNLGKLLDFGDEEANSNSVLLSGAFERWVVSQMGILKTRTFLGKKLQDAEKCLESGAELPQTKELNSRTRDCLRFVESRK